MLFVPDPSIERVRPPLSRRRRWIVWAGLVSVLLHAALLGGWLLWARQHPQAAVLAVPVHPATVQLVMAPPGSDHNAPATKPGAKGPQAADGAPQPPKPPQPPRPPAPTKTAEQKPQQQPKPPAPAKTTEQKPPQPQPNQIASPARPQAEPSPIASAPESPRRHAESPPSHAELPPRPEKPTPPAAAAAPALSPQPFKLSLGALESDTNALVTGNIVVPPSPDIKFHNRKPSYPPDAVLHGEQGAVTLLVHVLPDGLVDGVEVARSSGYRTLDDSARETVRSWHFLPSVQEGQPVEADVPVRIIYALDN